jgi:hypothetical protein
MDLCFASRRVSRNILWNADNDGSNRQQRIVEPNGCMTLRVISGITNEAQGNAIVGSNAGHRGNAG